MAQPWARFWPLLFLGQALACADGITCLAGVESVPIFDPLATSAEVGDYTLTCGGGTSVSPLPLVTVEAVLNVNLLQTVTPTLTDGVNSYTGVFGQGNQVKFSNVAFDPTGIDFEFENFFVDPSAEPPGFPFQEDTSFSGPLLIGVTSSIQVVAMNGDIPEPSTWLLAAGALAVLLSRRMATSN
jgi:PEP-CTERM motif